MYANTGLTDPVVVCDADNRRFVTDLDRWSIYALIGTASYYQAFALRDAFYKHLAFENFIGVAFPVSMSSLPKHCPKSIADANKVIIVANRVGHVSTGFPSTVLRVERLAKGMRGPPSGCERKPLKAIPRRLLP
jgi:hypothetical protein